MILALFVLVVIAGTASAQNPLPDLAADVSRTTVSGLSSGGYMAGQFHLAYGDIIVGAGIVAAGPYACARGDVARALAVCTETGNGTPNAARLVDLARERAEAGLLAPLTTLRDDRVYIYSGAADRTVERVVVDATVAVYRALGLTDTVIDYQRGRAGHGLLVEDGPVACTVTAAPFINDCDRDQAGEILTHFYGTLQTPRAGLLSGIFAGGRSIPFDQTAYLTAPRTHGMDTTGFVFVPGDCADAPGCAVHLALHGCRQGAAQIGKTFIEQAGYDRWAATNRLIVLYPQAYPTPANPRGCWDWWGYDDAEYATRQGRQVAALRAMIADLAGEAPPPFCRRHRGFTWQLAARGLAQPCANPLFVCAAGSGDPLGVWAWFTTVYETAPGFTERDPGPACG